MAGSDFVETNTFNGTAVSQSDYGTQHLVRHSPLYYRYIAVVIDTLLNSSLMYMVIKLTYFNLGLSDQQGSFSTC